MAYGKIWRRMPALTPPTALQCAPAVSGHTVKVPSSSGPGEYTVWVRGAEATCTCPAGKFRGKCKHIAAAQAELCTWRSTHDQPQSPQEEMSMTCPSCGGPVTPVQVAA